MAASSPALAPATVSNPDVSVVAGDMAAAAVAASQPVADFDVGAAAPALLEALNSPVAAAAALGAAAVAFFGARRGPPEWLEELPMRYNLDHIEAYWLSRPLALVQRLLEIGLGSAGFALQLQVDGLMGRSEEMEEERAIQLCETLARWGPAFVKIAQVWASRPDVLSEAYAKQVARLLENVPPFDQGEAVATLRRSIPEPEGMFQSMSEFERPIAAASVGQVYRMHLKDGRRVAVKVQRPNVRETVTLDLYVVRLLVKLGTGIPYEPLAREARNFLEVVDFSTPPFILELDYEAEAANQRRFAKTVEDCDLIADTVVVPEVIFSSNEVLVQEWLDGKKLTEPGAAQEQAGRVVKLLLNAYMVQFLETGFLHGDPHPGNFLLTPTGKLGILDYGLMTEIPRRRRVAFIEYLMHLQARDYDKCLDDLVVLQFIPESVAQDPDARALIVPSLKRALASFFEQGGDLRAKAEFFKNEYAQAQSSGKLEMLKGKLLEITEKYGLIVRLPNYFSLILRVFATLEGLGLKSDENFAIVQECFPYIARRLLTDDSFSMRNALRSYLYKGGARIAVERVDEIAGGFTTFTNLMKGSRGEAAASGAPLPTGAATDADSREAGAQKEEVASGAKADAATRDLAQTVFSPQGNFLQDLLIEEGVAAIDAMSRAALLGLVRSSVSLPFTLPSMLVPALLSDSDRLLTPADKDSLLLIRRIVRLTQRTVDTQMEKLEEDSHTSWMEMGEDVAHTAAELQKLKAVADGIMPSISPGAEAFADRFTQQLVKRVLSRLARDLERSAGLRLMAANESMEAASSAA